VVVPRVDAKCGVDKGLRKQGGGKAVSVAQVTRMGWRQQRPAEGGVDWHGHRAGCRAASSARIEREARSGGVLVQPFGQGLFNVSKLENFELKFEISKYKSYRPHTLLQLSQLSTYAFLNRLPRKALQSLGFSRFGQHCFQGFD
jgi:hypothetical protein